MDLAIRAIGRLKSTDPKSLLIEDYLTRINRSARPLGFKGVRLDVHEGPRQMNGEALMRHESDWLSSGTTNTDFVVAMDERGKDHDSQTFTTLLETQRDNGTSRMVFLIGGADGHTDMIRQRAQLTMRFGKATWPHMLARVMLCEQLYRAMTILSGHPYHRG